MQDLTTRSKLYVLTRADLSPGQQATQSVHAAFQFSHQHPILMSQWLEQSTYLVLLAAEDEDDLIGWIDSLTKHWGHPCSVWREPDMGNQVTAVAIAPSPRVERLLSSLPLTLKPARNEEPSMA